MGKTESKGLLTPPNGKNSPHVHSAGMRTVNNTPCYSVLDPPGMIPLLKINELRRFWIYRHTSARFLQDSDGIWPTPIELFSRTIVNNHNDCGKDY